MGERAQDIAISERERNMSSDQTRSDDVSALSVDTRLQALDDGYLELLRRQRPASSAFDNGFDNGFDNMTE